ncbi:MAG: hypothetical protein KDE27_16845 [Planctomycetes bacterium]|nr:hypothetical protein [Planctomycetota bacterium]
MRSPGPGAVRAFAELFRRERGQALPTELLGQVADVLGSRLAALRFESFDQYADLLANSAARAQEWDTLVAMLGASESYFLRNAGHWRAFEECVLPWLLAGPAAPARPLRIWVAGCAAGEEAYSAALAALRALPAGVERAIEVVGTDLREDALAIARDGVYDAGSLREIAPALRREHFEARADGTFRVGERLRALVRFDHGNLLDDAAMRAMRDFDVVFCRNVLTGFDGVSAAAVLHTLCASLRPGGYLFLGQPEIGHAHSVRLATISFDDTFFYKALPDARVAAAPPTGTRAGSSIPHGDRADGPNSAPASPPSATDTLCDRAFTLLLREQLPEAQQVFERLLGLDPDHEGGLLGTALLHKNAGRHDVARRQCDRAIRLRPESAEAHGMRGIVTEAAGEDRAAERDLQRAVGLDPGFAAAQFRLGCLCARRDEAERAEAAFRAAIRALEADSPARIARYSDGLGKEALRSLCEQRLSAPASRG